MSESIFRRFSGDFTNVMVPASSTTSWSIPVDTITFLGNGSNQGVTGSLASIDMYRSYTFPLPPYCPSVIIYLSLNLIYFTDAGIQVTNDVARQIYSGTPGAQAISSTLWSIPCNSTFPISLTFAGKPFKIDERDTIIQQIDGTCTGVVTGGATQGIGKVGAPFLRNFYTYVSSFLFYADFCMCIRLLSLILFLFLFLPFFSRQFAAVKSPSGTVQFSVGFAAKNLRQAPTQTTPSPGPRTTVKPPPSSSTTSTPSGSGAQTIQSLPTLGLMAVSIAMMIFLY